MKLRLGKMKTRFARPWALVLSMTLLPLALANCSYFESSSDFFDVRAEKVFEFAPGVTTREFDVLVDGESLFVDVSGGASLTLVSPIAPGGTGGLSSGGGSSGGAPSGGSPGEGGALGGLGGLGGFGGSPPASGGTSASGGYGTSTGGYGYEYDCPWYDTTATSYCSALESSYFNQNRRFTFRIARTNSSSRLEVVVYARAGSWSSEEGPRTLGVVIQP